MNALAIEMFASGLLVGFLIGVAWRQERAYHAGYLDGYATGAVRQAQNDGTEIVVGEGAAK